MFLITLEISFFFKTRKLINGSKVSTTFTLSFLDPVKQRRLGSWWVRAQLTQVSFCVFLAMAQKHNQSPVPQTSRITT